MPDPPKRKLRVLALLLCSALLLVVLASGHRGNTYVGPRRFLVTVDTNGIPHLYGISLANRFVRGGVFRVIAWMDGEVDFEAPRGWIGNPTVNSNVVAASQAINQAGLSPGARTIRLIMRDHPEYTNTNTFILIKAPQNPLGP